MEIKQKIEVKLKDYEKCSLVCDYDCPVGTIYDYASALIAFCLDKMKQAEEAQKALKQVAEQKQEEPQA